MLRRLYNKIFGLPAKKFEKVDYESKFFNNTLKDAAKLLGIKVPDFEFYTYFPDNVSFCTGDGKDRRFSVEGRIMPANVLSGKYYSASNRIVLTRNDPLTRKPLSDKHMAINGLIMLRHAWQYQKKYGSFYHIDELGRKVEKPCAYEDASAFAIAFAFSRPEIDNCDMPPALIYDYITNRDVLMKLCSEIVERYNLKIDGPGKPAILTGTGRVLPFEGNEFRYRIVRASES